VPGLSFRKRLQLSTRSRVVERANYGRAMHFKTSVWVRSGDLGVLSVSTINDAYALIQRWPNKWRLGPFHDVREVLEKAVLGSVPPDEARKAFVAFLEQANMLAECDLA
jgi:hypothetical protein